MVDNEEDIPSGVMQESIFEMEYSQDTSLDMSKDTIVLPESMQVATRGGLELQTPSSSSLEL